MKNSLLLEELNNKCKIAVQVHLFYEDLNEVIINKTNSISVKFDLYVSIIFPEMYNNLEKTIKDDYHINYFFGSNSFFNTVA